MTSADELVRSGIRPVKRRVEDDLLALRGVVGVDIAEKITAGERTGQLGITAYVREKLPLARIAPGEVLPAEVEGVAVDVVADEFVLHRALLAQDAEFPDARGAERHKVVLGGISMGPARSILLCPPDAPRTGEYVIVGTLGALVTDRSGNGQVMGLTTFHAACVDDAWSVGDSMVHPSRADGGGQDDSIGTLCRAALSGSVDGAAALLVTSHPHRASIVDIGPITGTAVATRGAVVRKRGRTTGLTMGLITSTDATLKIDYRDGLGVRVLRNQLRVEVVGGGVMGDYGDSGAVLVDVDNRVVGLYFAGNLSGTAAFANPIDRVLDELDVELIT
ncbi:hypothetical protein [Kutzneria albida]|uniref:Uncharacterized protein n=1 Tax=Kutzneria albida DSM 43870 TaxID=1449976 RepID=W5WKL4_9PSEU|nr:hypothetical protein [Kutzneria albida]AHI01744.1 hypothetical protein KALB_8387 [Kutzneria albida DSM 43870]